MKKNIISTIVAAAGITASGAAFAASPEASLSVTLNTEVTSGSAISITASPSSETLTTEDAGKLGIKLASLDIAATGLTGKETTTGGANIKVTAETSNYDSGGGGSWIFKDGSKSFFVIPVTNNSPWQLNDNGTNVTIRTDNNTEFTNTTLDIVTKYDQSVEAGNYSLPVIVSYNTW